MSGAPSPPNWGISNITHARTKSRCWGIRNRSVSHPSSITLEQIMRPHAFKLGTYVRTYCRCQGAFKAHGLILVDLQ